MKKIIVFTLLSSLYLPSFGQADVPYSSRLRTSKDLDKYFFEYEAGEQVTTDLIWKTEILFGKSNGGDFNEIVNRTHQLVDKIEFYLNFNGKTTLLENETKSFDCNTSSGRVTLPIQTIKDFKISDKRTVEQAFSGADIDNLELIVKIIYRSTKCPGGSSILDPTQPKSKDEIYTLKLDYFGASFINMDIGDNSSDLGSIWNQFTKGLSYSQVGVATNFKSGLSGLATTPIINIKSAGWFMNHVDIEYMVSTMSTSGGDQSVITGMGGCIGLMGRKVKGLKLGYYINNDQDDGYFILAITPSILTSVSEFFSDMSRHKPRKRARR